MASLDFNPMVPGRFGRAILTRRGDRVFFSRPPVRTTAPSAAEVQARQRFREAAAYSKEVYAHPARKAQYAALPDAREKGVFALIMADFVPNPLIRSVDLAAYHGHVGDAIRVERRPDMGVQEVVVQLRRDNLDRTLVEAGAATLDNGFYRFLATAAVPVGTAMVAEITMTDTDGIAAVRAVKFVVA